MSTPNKYGPNIPKRVVYMTPTQLANCEPKQPSRCDRRRINGLAKRVEQRRIKRF